MNTFFIQYIKKYISICLLCILFVFTFVLYYKTLFLGFFSDDYHFLHIMSQTDFIWKFFLTNNIGRVAGGSYGPVLDILWWMQYSLFGMRAIWYHTVVLGVYAMTAWFVYILSYKWSGRRLLGIYSALLFLVLQNHSSSIAWVSVMPHVWATLFFIAGLYNYFLYITKHKSWRYVISFVLMMLSLFTKETAVMYPFILILMDMVFGYSTKHWVYRLWYAFRRVSVFILGTILYFIIRYSVVGYVAGYYAQSHISFQLMPKIHMFVEIVLSMGLLSPHRQYVLGYIMTHRVICIFICLVLILLFVVIEKSYRRILGFLLTSYAIMSVPFVNLMFDPTSNSGERYGYVLSVFFVMILVMWLYALLRRVSWGDYIFYIMMIIIIGGSMFQMIFKLNTWYVSADIRDGIISDIAQFDFHPDDYVIFISLPDNIRGVELMRNAILEMIDLETDKGFVKGERIPLYTEVDMAYVDVQSVDLDIYDMCYHFMGKIPKRHVFTGLPSYENDAGIYEIIQFRHYDHSGIGIHMDIDTEFLDAYDGRVVLAYFDGQMMQFVTVHDS